MVNTETFDTFTLCWEYEQEPAALTVVVTDSEGEEYLKAFIKWDGCANVEFTPQHFCGVHHFVTHCLLLRHIYESAKAILSGTGHIDEPSWPDVEKLYTGELPCFG